MESSQRPPSLSARLCIKAIELYQGISKYTPPMCRFTPTCSEYARQAIAKYGVVKGTWMGTKRICRCHPFHPGGDDPVP